MEPTESSLAQKLQSLTPDQLTKVEELVASLQADDSYRAALSLSEPAFASVWNDPENDVYDEL